MILPSGGFFTLGVLLLVFNRIRSRQEQQQALLQEVAS
jgi:Na+-translocating ferredoxin:NAD+ oxidoreductase RnfE subunit